MPRNQPQLHPLLPLSRQRNLRELAGLCLPNQPQGSALQASHLLNQPPMQNIFIWSTRSPFTANAPTPTSLELQDTFHQQLPSARHCAGATPNRRRPGHNLSAVPNTTHVHAPRDARPASPTDYSSELSDHELLANFCTQTGPTSTSPTPAILVSPAVARLNPSGTNPKVATDRNQLSGGFNRPKVVCHPHLATARSVDLPL